MHFFRSLWGLVKEHPVTALLALIGIVLVLGGLVWKLINFVLGLLRKIPGGGAVASAVETVATKTGSAVVLFLPGALAAGHYLAHAAQAAPLF